MTAFAILSSGNHAVTGAAYTYQPDSGVADPNALNDPKPWLIRVWSNVGIHLRSDGQPATTNDYPLAAGYQGALVNVAAGGSLSVIKQSGESDGVAWFSHVKRG